MINKKKIMQSVSLIVLTAVLYGNAYAPKKDMPQPDFKGFTKACATQEMIASSLHNADYITSTHPNTGFLDADNEHEVSIEQNDTPVVTEAASSQAIKWSGPVLYANNYCQVYADKEMTQPLFTLNYNDAAQVSGMVSTSEIQVTVNDQTGYVPLSSFSDNVETPVTSLIPFYPTYHGQKTYMDYRTITSTGTYEYKLQNTVAYTNNDDGIRMINGRYCIAVGTAFGARIGQYIDLTLENGTVIHCVMGDTKSDEHTDPEHVFTVASGCCSEFIVEIEKLNGVAKSGDVSNAHPEWKSAVSKIMVYNKFVE